MCPGGQDEPSPGPRVWGLRKSRPPPGLPCFLLRDEVPTAASRPASSAGAGPIAGRCVDRVSGAGSRCFSPSLSGSLLVSSKFSLCFSCLAHPAHLGSRTDPGAVFPVLGPSGTNFVVQHLSVQFGPTQPANRLGRTRPRAPFQPGMSPEQRGEWPRNKLRMGKRLLNFLSAYLLKRLEQRRVPTFIR